MLINMISIEVKLIKIVKSNILHILCFSSFKEDPLLIFYRISTSKGYTQSNLNIFIITFSILYLHFNYIAKEKPIKK